MPANPWELRADVRPLEVAAQRWSEIAVLMARRGDDIVDAARRASEGWDSATAESYEHHRRQVLATLDRFTQVAVQLAGSLRVVSTILTSAQKELDQSWTGVALVPHDVVGAARHLVFRPSLDEDRGKVTRGEAEAAEIRRRLTLALDEEAARLQSARAELVMVRTELTTLPRGTFAQLLASVGEASGVGTLAPPSSTSVPGSARSGVVEMPPIAAISVSVPDLTGLSSSGLAPLAATAASGLATGRRKGRTTSAAPPLGGMGAGAMGARAGTMSRGTASGRSGPRPPATPQLQDADDDGARSARTGATPTGATSGPRPGSTRAARGGAGSGSRSATENGRAADGVDDARDAEREAKRAALAEKRAERAARKAERDAARAEQGRESGGETDAGGGPRRR